MQKTAFINKQKLICSFFLGKYEIFFEFLWETLWQSWERLVVAAAGWLGRVMWGSAAIKTTWFIVAGRWHAGNGACSVMTDLLYCYTTWILIYFIIYRCVITIANGCMCAQHGGSQHWCKHTEEDGCLQFGYRWDPNLVLWISVDTFINEEKLKTKHKISVPLPQKNLSWSCKFIIPVITFNTDKYGNETRHEWEEAVFKGTVLSAQRRAHASCSGGCGQMVTASHW